MRALLGPRFGVEATFIVAVAVVAGLFELPLPAILTAVFGAWVLVALAEVAASRRAARARPVLGTPPAPPAPLTAPLEPATGMLEPIVVRPVPERAAREPERQPQRPPSAAVPGPGVEREPAPEPASQPGTGPEPEPQPAVVALPREEPPRAWNLWDLERRFQSGAASSTTDREELSYLLLYLRDYATADGDLPVEFDALVRESFGELVAAE